MRDLDLLRLERRVGLMLAPLAGKPGAAVGVARGGALLLRRSGGLASVEHDIPIGPDTAFRIASVSKHVTCAALLLLEREGRLSLADPVGKYLPHLPESLRSIRLDLLARNASGVRDMFDLLRLGGADLSLSVSEAELDAAIARATGLNFAPGSRFLYSNTGFRWLGQVVERVSGEALAEFLRKRIFAPLGMTRTAHTPDLLVPVPGLATGYLADGRRAPHGLPLGGEGGLASTVEDLALWSRGLARAALGEGMEAALSAMAPFTGGASNRYALGLENEAWRGLALVGHGGLWPGYKSALLRLPSRALTVIVLANSAALDPGRMAFEVMEAALEGDGALAPAPEIPSRDGLAGRWISMDTGLSLDIAEDGTARMHGVPFALLPGEGGRWVARRGAFPFSILPRHGEALEVELDAGTVVRFERAPGGPLPALDGSWSSAELGAEWRIEGEAVEVSGPLRSGARWRLEALAPGFLRLHMPSVLFDAWADLIPDAGGTRLTVNSGRVRGLVMERR
ncbi:serine hydrolase domain-containing protein [Sabulicella rubraurantiaca]|uniref:serine hydrolase domain-containing protein n=1 Tax=Sabulicella rubraurantiaca TaxID=2811429 RepID=UPI001A96F83F|nr:serine hydrolase [Sabulicella rubraurantiaca]